MATTIKGAPVTLYRNGKSTTVHAIDAQAWRVNGWTEDPSNEIPEKEIKELESGKKKETA
jgi:hypothetical protein